MQCHRRIKRQQQEKPTKSTTIQLLQRTELDRAGAEAKAKAEAEAGINLHDVLIKIDKMNLLTAFFVCCRIVRLAITVSQQRTNKRKLFI